MQQLKLAKAALIVNGSAIKVFAERDPGNLPWGSVGVEIVS